MATGDDGDSKRPPEQHALAAKAKAKAKAEVEIEVFHLAPEEFKEHLEKLAEIYREAYRKLGRYGYRGRSQIRSYLRWLYGTDPEGFLAARRPEGELVGFIAVCRHWWDPTWGEVGEIHELVVHPNWQGQGIGSRLFGEGLKLLEGERLEVLGLWVGEGNLKAIEFYKKRGFTEAGKAGSWLRMIKIGSSCRSKRLPPRPG